MSEPRATEAEVEKGEKTGLSKLASEGVLLLVATAGAYLCGYLHEFGQSLYFGYPTEFIALGSQNLLLIGTASAMLVMVVLGAMGIYPATLSIFDDLGDGSAIIRKLKTWGVVLIGGFFIWTVSLFDMTIGVWFLLGPAIAIFADFVTALLFSRVFRLRASVEDHFEAERVRTRSDLEAIRRRGMETAYFRLTNMIVAALVVGIAFLAAGIGSSRSRTDFGLVERDGTQVVLKRFGDTFVLAKYDAKANVIQREFTLVAASDLKEKVRMRRLSGVTVGKIDGRDGKPTK